MSDVAAGFKGVAPHHNGKFQAQIKENGKLIHLGTYTTAVEAALAYARHSKERAAAEEAAAREEGRQALNPYNTRNKN